MCKSPSLDISSLILKEEMAWVYGSVFLDLLFKKEKKSYQAIDISKTVKATLYCKSLIWQNNSKYKFLNHKETNFAQLFCPCRKGRRMTLYL